jgi:hypothetical protein
MLSLFFPIPHTHTDQCNTEPALGTEASVSANEILYVIAKNMKVDELVVEIKMRKHDYVLKKAKYLPATNLLYHFCTKSNRFIMDEDDMTFDSVRQWGLYATQKKQPLKLSVKGVTFVGDKTIAWHEANGA